MLQIYDKVGFIIPTKELTYKSIINNVVMKPRHFKHDTAPNYVYFVFKNWILVTFSSGITPMITNGSKQEKLVIAFSSTHYVNLCHQSKKYRKIIQFRHEDEGLVLLLEICWPEFHFRRGIIASVLEV